MPLMSVINSNLILRLDVAGAPIDWVTREQAALLYSRDQVRWEAGETRVSMFGGWSRLTGERSVLHINSIVATRGVARDTAIQDHNAPGLSNRALFRRDQHLCLYCGEQFPGTKLTRDHVVPVSRGGKDSWENVVSACVGCNTRKGNRTLDEVQSIGMRLIAVPYAPNRAEGLILANRHILVDQMQFLMARVGRDSRLHTQ